jgi:hypothetical protein
MIPAGKGATVRARDRGDRRAARRKGVAVVVLMILISAALCAFIAGCGEGAQSPRSVLKKFFKAIESGQVQASYRLLSSADRKKMDIKVWSRSDGGPALGGIPLTLHFIVSDADINGDQATVDVLIGDDSDTGNARDLRFFLVNEDGAWKVSDLKTVTGKARHVETGGGINWSHVAFGSGTESTAKSIVYGIMGLAIYLFYAIGLWRISKAKKVSRSWFAWVPILNTYLAWRIVGKGVLRTVLSFIPIVNIILYFLWCFGMARACGKGRVYGLLQLIPVVNFVIFWLLVEAVEDSATAGPGIQAEAAPAT